MPEFIAQRAKPPPRNTHAIKINEAMPPPGSVAMDRFLNLAFGPAINVVWDCGVSHAAENISVVNNRCHFVVLTKVQADPQPGQETVSRLEGKHARFGNPIHLQEPP